MDANTVIIGPPLDFGTPTSEAHLIAAGHIARTVFGGVAPGSSQWETCIEAAKAMDTTSGSIAYSESFGDVQSAFKQCNEFNKKYAVGTRGTITNAMGQKVQTQIEQKALVFPNPRVSHTVMAWFASIGWYEISTFAIEKPVLTLSEELINIGLQIKNQNRPDMARYIFKAALMSDPGSWHAHNEEALYLHQRFLFEEAYDHFTKALKAKPDSGEILNNRAMTLRALGRSDEAIADCELAMQLLPGNDAISLNAASAYDDVGKTEESLKLVNAHFLRNPNNANSHYNKALTLLSCGQFDEGWMEFEWRLRQPMVNCYYEHYDIPRWRGESLEGKKILVWAEQGVGDEIMTATMIPDLIEAGASVSLLCDHRLIPIFKRSFPTVDIGERPNGSMVDLFRRELLRPEITPRLVRENKFDIQMSQGDLGKIFRRNFDMFPKEGPLLKSAVSSTFSFESHIRKIAAGRKVVGLGWHSKKNIRIGELKSLPLKALGPILRNPDCLFVNLQYGDCSEEMLEVESEFGITIYRPQNIDPLTDLDSYATVIASLDLVITASNTTAHLAGALGIKTWVLAPEGPGRLWYHFRHREDWPWYPSVRLFRQERAMQWGKTVQRVADELRKAF